MADLNANLLTAVVFLPLAWATVGLLIPTGSKAGQSLTRGWSVIGTLLTFVVSLLLYYHYQPAGDAFQFYQKDEWLPALGISYAVGIDGISLWLILLTTVLMPIVVLSSFQAIHDRVKEYYFLLLALETAMLGAFVSLDLFLFYIFWEAMLIPMYFMIGIWGGKERIYAATKFFLFTLVGSLLMLVAIFYISNEYRLQTGHYSTLLTDLYTLSLPDMTFSAPNASCS